MGKIRQLIKIFYIAAINLFNMLKYRSRLILVVVISISVSIFGILFYSGYFLYTYYEAAGGSSIIVEVAPETEKNEVWKLVEQMWMVGAETEKIYVVPDESDGIQCVGAYNKNWEAGRFLLIGKNFFYDENTASVIMAEYLVDSVEDGDIPIGRDMVFQESVFEVTGIVSFTEYDAINVPVKYFVTHYDTNIIEYSYAEQLNSVHKEKLEEIVADSSIVVNYSILNENNPFMSEEFVTVFFQILLIFMIVVVNAFSMAYYSVMLLKRNYRIYAVCGASKKCIQAIIVIQNALVILASVIMGNAIYIIGKNMIKEYGVVYQGNYSIYVGISLIVFVVLIIFAYLLAKKAVKTDVIYISVE